MIKLICPKCGNDEIYLRGDKKSKDNKDLFKCDCGKEFTLNQSEWEQE